MATSAQKLVTWNICHGGGSGVRRHRIIDTLLSFDADLLVVTEFRIGEAGTAIQAALKAAGYYSSYPPLERGRNTVLVASRQAIDQAESLDSSLADARHLWRVVTGGLSVVGVYMPVGVAKLEYWEAVLRAASAAEQIDVFVGDFNTGRNDLDKAQRGERYIGAEFMDRMSQAGYTDVWRTRYPTEREYSWFSPQGQTGFRLDHAFASVRFADAVQACRYDHTPRVDTISDHSALVVEFLSLSPKIVIPAEAKASTICGCIYALQDPGCIGLLKIGKDQKWPQRLRQAQSHTPRGMREVGRWVVLGSSRSDLAAAERQILAMFDREPSCPGREWLRVTANEAVHRISKMLGEPLPQTDAAILRVYDDWRDWERPGRSVAPRRLWIGSERQTGHLKVIHSVHVDLFRRFCPTYNRYGIDWHDAWEWPTAAWSPSSSLHPFDQHMVDLWEELVIVHGYGTQDGRVGWLRGGTSLSLLRERCREEGLLFNDPSSILR